MSKGYILLSHYVYISLMNLLKRNFLQKVFHKSFCFIYKIQHSSVNPTLETSRVGFVIRSIPIFFPPWKQKSTVAFVFQLSFGFRRMKLVVEIFHSHKWNLWFLLAFDVSKLNSLLYAKFIMKQALFW